MTNKTLCATLLGLWALHGVAQADPAKTTWEELRQARSADCASFLEPYLAQADCKRQSMMAKQAKALISQCTTGDTSLDGTTITIAGYAHPFELAFKDVRAFLLVPRTRQDCRHPPPPLPDQVISVEFPDGLDIGLDPVWITGTVRAQSGKSHLAPFSYVLEATEVAPAFLPDVPDSG